MYRILYKMHRAVLEYLATCDEDVQTFVSTVYSSGGTVVAINPIYN